MRLAAVVALLVCVPGVAGAVDGVIELSHEVALTGGVNGSLATDPAGYPIAITRPGSYRLTGNLTLSSAGQSGITVSSDRVRIDLNGFSILGVNSCSGGFGTPVTCTSNGSGVGIFSAVSADIEVEHGSVRGMGSAGIRLTGLNARVRNVLVESNGADGIELGNTGEARDCRAFLNLQDGISTLDSAQVRDSASERNGLDGIDVRANARLLGNISNGNGQLGIHCVASCSAIGNTASSNGGDGIAAGANALISENTVFGNGDDGIQMSNGVAVGNTVDGNAACGLGGTSGSFSIAAGLNRAANNGSAAVCPAQFNGAVATACNLVRCASGSFVSFCPPSSVPACP
jgi:hypothetical protein